MGFDEKDKENKGLWRMNWNWEEMKEVERWDKRRGGERKIW